MYTHIWNKYLPVIRILLKKSAKEAQTLAFNMSDFEKTGPQKKTGFNFTLEFNNGRLYNRPGLSNPAKELAAVLTQDSLTNNLLQRGEYHLTMTAKFVLTVKQVSSNVEATPVQEVVEEAI